MSEGGELVEHLRRIFDRRHARARAMKPRNIVGILGTSKNDGNTETLAKAVFSHLPDANLFNLNDFSVAPYDYDHHYRGDDFLPLAEQMAAAKTVVFVSPVYWYSMSAQMKTFFDRLTDLTDYAKPIGKSLGGKSAFLIATGGSPAPPASFEPPFAETARYFNMNWGGMLYGRRETMPAEAQAFAGKIAGSVRPASAKAA